MGVPAYAIVSDAVLRAISEAQPKNRSELARIRGVGPRALAKFGDDLLRVAGAGPSAADQPMNRLDPLGQTG
jgi:superfamily II DNA helicase RecQ